MERGWRAATGMLVDQGGQDLAVQVRRFMAQMPPVATETERLAAELQVRTRSPSLVHERQDRGIRDPLPGPWYLTWVLPRLAAATNSTATALLPHDYAREHPPDSG